MDFVRPLTGALALTTGHSLGGALAFHFSLELNEEAVEEALREGAMGQDFDVLIRPRRALTVLDAVVLAGRPALALALAALGAPCAAAPAGDFAAWLLIEEGPPGCYVLDPHAVEAALAVEGLEVEAMQLDMLEIKFKPWIRKRVDSFSLLDVAVCLGQEDVARMLAERAAGRFTVQASIACKLHESHLQCIEEQELFFSRLYKAGNHKALDKRRADRCAAAASAAAELDLARERERVEYMILFAQWDRHCFSRRRSGKNLLCQPTLLRRIFELMLPGDLLLTLPRLQEVFNTIRPGSTVSFAFPARCLPGEAADLTRRWLGGVE